MLGLSGGILFVFFFFLLGGKYENKFFNVGIDCYGIRVLELFGKVSCFVFGDVEV